MSAAIIAIVVLAIAAAAWWFWPVARLTYSGAPLDPHETYEFMFLASFPTEGLARECSQKIALSSLSTKIAPSPNNTAFMATWTIVAKANARRILKRKQDIETAIASSGGTFIVFAASREPNIVTQSPPIPTQSGSSVDHQA